jgi:hypothetical protein
VEFGGVNLEIIDDLAGDRLHLARPHALAIPTTMRSQIPDSASHDSVRFEHFASYKDV